MFDTFCKQTHCIHHYSTIFKKSRFVVATRNIDTGSILYENNYQAVAGLMRIRIVTSNEGLSHYPALTSHFEPSLQ